MVFLGDDVEMYLVCEGRETWRVTGEAVRVLVCPNCGNTAKVEGGEEYPPGHKDECWQCEILVEAQYRDAWECSECDIAVYMSRDDFVAHVEREHPPKVTP